MKASWRHPLLSRDSRAHSESTAARAREELAALQGQGLRRARAPDVLRGPRGLQHARPDGPHSAAAAGAPDRRGFFLLRRRRALRLRAARGAEAEAHAPRAGQRQVPRSPRHAGRPLKLADHYLTWRRRTWPVSMTRREELEHRAATHCRECLASFETAEKKLHHCHGTGQYLPLLQHRGPDAQDHPSGLSQRGRLRLPLPAALHRHDGLSREQGDYLCLRVLCKSGEKCLQMSWGPLRFVDSMNVFPTSLASMIDDLRAHAQAAAGALPADGLASPRAAAAHADGLSEDGLSNSGGRTASWSRRGTASCASCPCPSSTSAAPRRGRCPQCGSSTATTACWRGRR